MLHPLASLDLRLLPTCYSATLAAFRASALYDVTVSPHLAKKSRILYKILYPIEYEHLNRRRQVKSCVREREEIINHGVERERERE